jgi:membrane protein
MTINYKAHWDFIKEVSDKFSDDKVTKLGAALSFYTIFSLSPLLIISISVAGAIFGQDAANGAMIGQIKDLIGLDGAKLIQTALVNAQYKEHSFVPLVISIITLIIGSTVVFIDLQESLNMIWKVKAKPSRNYFRGLLLDRLQSFAVVIGTGFLLLVSLIVSAAISGINYFVSKQFFALPVIYLHLTNTLISLLLLFLLFLLLFRVLPDVHIAWRHVSIGALFTAILFELGKYLIGIYLGTSTLGSTYGAAGSLVVLLLWVYYSSQILFLGAEIILVYANKYGKGIKPADKFMKYRN